MSSMQRLAAALGSILAGAWLGLGCGPASVFQCESSEQCQAGALQGVCTEAGYCAFEDESCESELAYGELAAPELAGKCVPVEGGTETDVDGGTSLGTTTSSSSGPPPPPSTSDESGPTDPCPAGEPCETADPCATGGMCDANGTCVPTGVIGCGAPPGPCFLPDGQCQPDGSCSYPPAPPMSGCEDGDPCTEGDACDGMGTCIPGPLCPNAGACQLGTCTEMGCAYEPAADGSPCGAAAADRCCGGTCVDISTDPAHCGGCGSACVEGQDCESVAATPECNESPEATSARCRCTTDDDCPLGQLCRTQAPYVGRCAPSSEQACAGVVVQLDMCPNYCAY